MQSVMVCASHLAFVSASFAEDEGIESEDPTSMQMGSQALCYKRSNRINTSDVYMLEF